LTLTIPDVPPSLNKVLNLHWRNQQKLKDKWKLLVRAQIIPIPMNLAQKKRVRITLHHARPYDEDNAYGACKVLIDALKSWNLIWDDSAKYLTLFIWQERCPHKKRHTIIELEPA
jgi:hypothetical protein